MFITVRLNFHHLHTMFGLVVICNRHQVLMTEDFKAWPTQIQSSLLNGEHRSFVISDFLYIVRIPYVTNVYIGLAEDVIVGRVLNDSLHFSCTSAPLYVWFLLASNLCYCALFNRALPTQTLIFVVPVSLFVVESSPWVGSFRLYPHLHTKWNFIYAFFTFSFLVCFLTEGVWKFLLDIIAFSMLWR